ncbi:MAG: hypothetical protein JNG90_14320, partial [Planctomycetaceae bacterium]|nr:hypothetical protein [Planctomycetaceae bacterium]
MESTSRAKSWPPVTLGLLLALGAAAVWMVLLGLLVLLWSAYTTSQSSERLHVAQSGDVLVQVYRDGDVSFRTPAGEPVPEAPTGVAGVSLPRPSREADPHSIPWTSCVWGFLIEHPRRERWYLMHDGHPQGRAYFVG